MTAIEPFHYKTVSDKRYLFHGTSTSDNLPFDNGISAQFKEQSKDYANAFVEGETFHGVNVRAVWLSDKVHGARFYATDHRSSYCREGWIYVIDLAKITDYNLYYHGDGGEVETDEGDIISHNEQAFVSDIPACAIIDCANANDNKEMARLIEQYESV